MESHIFNNSAKFYDLFYKKKNYKKEVKFIYKFFPLNNKNLKIVDLGVGSGNHFIEILKKGHIVDGVEISKRMLDCLIDKINKQKLKKNYKLYNKDIALFKGRKEKYDVAISLFHVINYLKNYGELKKFFSNNFYHLKENGILIFDCWNYQLVKKGLDNNSIKKIKFKNRSIVRKGNIQLSNKNKIKIKYNFEEVKNNKVIQNFKEVHNLTAFSKSQIIKASIQNFNLLNYCVWFDKLRKPDHNQFSCVFILQKKSNKKENE